MKLSDLNTPPNVIILYADDLGFGDLSCYGADRIKTPHIDRLAEEGILFQQGYATAATCTPSRYSLLTGSYPWRNPEASILRGDADQIIESGAPTLPQMFKDAGYTTGIIGKWHLGIGKGGIDWNSGQIQGTPNDVGFDVSYIMAATNDRAPCVYLDNRRVENLDPSDPLDVTYDREKAFPEVPTYKTHPELCVMKGHGGGIVNGYPRLGFMRGGKSATWDDETMSDVFLDRAKGFIESNTSHPFFLYYAFHQPHAPRIPAKRFVGSTDLGPRGDVIVELDWCVGEIMSQLDELGIRENTIVVFSSDNGPVLWDQYEDNSIELAGDFRPAGPLRGGKYSSYDGGTRVPFIVSCPRYVKEGTSEALVSQVDLYASFASMLGTSLKEDEAPDSFDLLDALLGQSSEGRDALILEGNGKNTIYREGDWAYIPPRDGPEKMYNGIELGNSLKPQLFNLSQDIGQGFNVANEHESIVEDMNRALSTLKARSSTRKLPTI